MEENETARRRTLIEDALDAVLPKASERPAVLGEAMRWAVEGGGKRIRPLVCLAAAEAVGGRLEDALFPACAIELLHSYTLIHDDLPAMDNDDYRRGKLTNHKVYGDGMAVLAGDALLTLAFEVIARQKHTDPATLLRVVQEISTAAGMNGMVGGQAIDLESEGHRIPMQELQKMHMGKTGALFRAALRSGAILAGATEGQLAALTSYAEGFGLAFQITDDILDVTGDEKLIGKPVGSDIRNEKSTYVTLTSLDEAQRLAEETVDKAVKALAVFGPEADFLRQLVRYMLERKN